MLYTFYKVIIDNLQLSVIPFLKFKKQKKRTTWSHDILNLCNTKILILSKQM